MSQATPPDEGTGTTDQPSPDAPTAAERYGVLQRAGGVAAPLLTALIAFAIGGIVVMVQSGSFASPFTYYWEVFQGAGISWFWELGSNEIGLPFTDATVWFPWDTGSQTAYNLQQTLITWTPLVLTGLAVAFAFRCGLFNIGGQGQYTIGAVAAVLVGAEVADAVELPDLLTTLLAIVVAMLAGGALAGIAGFLKATRGVHEVITTIMLNWIVIWVASYLFDIGGPLQTPEDDSLPLSKDVVEGARLTVWWGDPVLQGLHTGFFLALGALVVYWAMLNRTTFGYGVRAVGFNPEAARYGGISVKRNYFLAMAVAGAFAGLAGALDILGWKLHVDKTDIANSTIGFVGIAVALLGRNRAVGVGLAAFLFAALQTGTSTRNLGAETFDPRLASNVTLIIQGLIVLFVGADVLVLVFLRKLRRRSATGSATA